MGLNSFFGDKFMKFDNGDIDFLGFFFHGLVRIWKILNLVGVYGP